MGQKYQVIGPLRIARPGLPDAMPADPASGRSEGDIFDVSELTPGTVVKALIKSRLIKAVEEPVKPAKKAAVEPDGEL